MVCVYEGMSASLLELTSRESLCWTKPTWRLLSIILPYGRHSNRSSI